MKIDHLLNELTWFSLIVNSAQPNSMRKDDPTDRKFTLQAVQFSKFRTTSKSAKIITDRFLSKATVKFIIKSLRRLVGSTKNLNHLGLLDGDISITTNGSTTLHTKGMYLNKLSKNKYIVMEKLHILIPPKSPQSNRPYYR